MATFSHPGVYIKEVPSGPSPLSGTSPSACGMVGFTLEGPTNVPTLVTSLTEFKRIFGGFTAKSKLPTGANLFFSNGGQQLYVVRATASDASKGRAQFIEAVSGESLSPDVALNGVITDIVFTNDIVSKLPVAKQSNDPSVTGIVITEGGVGASTYFKDVDGSGALSAFLISNDAPVANTLGQIDYETGEVSLTYATAPASTVTYSADYSFVNIRFDMAWEGSAGNDFRVMIFGDPNYEDKATASFSRFNVAIQRLNTDNEFEDQESFSNVVLDDPSHDRFILSVINDESAGSSFVRVETFADSMIPSVLIGESISNEAVTFDPAFDGLSSQFEIDLANSVSPSSFELALNLAFRESLGSISVGAPSITNATAGMRSIINDVRDAGAGTVVAQLSVSVDDTVNPPRQVSIDIEGNGAGAISGNVVDNGATISFVGDAEAGTYTISIDNGEQISVGLPISLSYVRANVLRIVDNGSGALELASNNAGDSDIVLDSNFSSTISYGDRASSNASLTLKLRLTTNPSFGPISLAGVVANARYHKQASKASSSFEINGGSDGSSLTRSDISSPARALNDEGLFAFNKTDVLLQMVIPDFETSSLVSQDLIDYCSQRKDRFALVSVPEAYSVSEAVDYKKLTINRNSVPYGAIYYPHLKIIDPVSEKEVLFPPCSAVAGIYARTDNVRNVSKAPAGTTDGALRGVTGVELELSPAQVGQTNLAHVNNIVNYPYTGLCVWGARTLQVGGDFPYIQMRRLFNFVEKSVFEGTQGFVFESNTDGLRLRVKLQVETFLLGLFNSGHFGGGTPAESFFVVCDRTNNTEADTQLGRLFVDVGLAPTRPAEFIVFRFQQKTLSE